MNRILILGLSMVFVVFGTVSFAEEQDSSGIFDLAVGIEGMGGETTYQIGGNIVYANGASESIHFPLSELEWPLDIWLGRIDAGLNIGDSWRINGVVKKNISDPDSNMKDSDWGVWYLDGDPGTSPSDLDIYSESNISDFDAVIFDIDVEWAFLQRETWSLFAGIGYQYQNFEYEGQLIEETGYYLGNPIGTFPGDGSVGITYEITYNMPYLLIGTDVNLIDNLTLAGSFTYAPWVEAEDEDHHLMRNKVSKGDMDGDAFMLDLSAQYNITPSWFLVAGFHYTKIDVDGDQNQTINGVPYVTIEETSESTQTSGYFKAGFTF